MDRTPRKSSRRNLPPNVSPVLNTTDELLGAVPWGRWRSVLVYWRLHGGREWIRLRTFNKHRTKGQWYPSPRFFVIPLECAQDLAKAIEAAATGEPFGPQPDWYAEFEEQYVARRSAKASV